MEIWFFPPKICFSHNLIHFLKNKLPVFILIKNIIWSIVDVQYYISYRYTIQWFTSFKSYTPRASLVVLWLRICLTMQETQAWSFVQEDPMCCEATKPMHHNFWDCALELGNCNYWACMLRLLSLHALEPVLWNRRSQNNEKPREPKQSSKACHN